MYDLSLLTQFAHILAPGSPVATFSSATQG
jgi:hypothetical protein